MTVPTPDRPGGAAMLRAVIFDMDGVLIDSEPFWQQAEIAVFATVGITLTPQLMTQVMGMRVDASVEHWYVRQPWVTPSRETVRDLILAEVVSSIEAHGKPMPGAVRALELVRRLGWHAALASSSPMMLIETVIHKLGLDGAFDVVHSAEFEEHGKPHPAVYLTTAARLGVPPRACVAIEDSVNGIIAAKAAGMKCIAVPDPRVRGDRRLGVADLVLPSLSELDEAVLRGLE